MSPIPNEGDATQVLIARLRAKDPAAGSLLHELYRPMLIRFCWGYLGQMDQAEDAVQDVCCKVLDAATIPDTFRPWIYRIARHHCLNLLRHRAVRGTVQGLPSQAQIRDSLTGQLTRMVRHEARERLAELVASLTVEQSEVLRLRYVENLSRAEIAEVLNCPESVVKSRLFEGLKRLRECAADLSDT